MPFTLTEQSRQLTTLAELIGKRILRAGSLDYFLVIEFDDNSWVKIVSNGDWDNPEPPSIDDVKPHNAEKVELGMISQEEWEQRLAATQASFNQDQSKKDRVEYERLKAKFEPKI